MTCFLKQICVTLRYNNKGESATHYIEELPHQSGLGNSSNYYEMPRTA
jgi:hypothetical protein